jgi:Zn-dependent M28 family amino/carboxypeptidase
LGLFVKHLVSALAGLAVIACSPAETSTDNQAAMPDISATNIEAHIRFLASDYLAGRDTGSEGYEIAANYVASQMRLLGLEPAGRDGSYFEAVPMHDVRADPGYNTFTLNGVTHAQGDQAYVAVNPSVLESEVSGELVFVGYGVSAPDHGHDDYADVDVDGKIAVILGGLPDGLPSEEAAHHGSANTVRAAAAAAGAVGIIFVSDQSADDLMTFTTGRAARFSTRLTAATGPSPHDQIVASATLSKGLSDALFDGAQMSFDDVVAAMGAEDGATFPHFDLPHTVTMRQRTISQPFSDPNVVGMLRGSDPVLADEVVILAAHLDHVGEITDVMRAQGTCRSNEDADSICNGAVDNASGVAIMLETARAFRTHGAPRRSILFVALASEEKGLLGSEHIARNPVVPADNVVANINLDMPVITYDFADILAFGGEHSTLGPLATTAAARMGITVSPDPIPEQSVFVRSDHYSFVRAGVPSIMLATGFDSPDERWAQGEGFMGFLRHHYHRQSDELDSEMEVLFDQGAKFANLNFLVAREVANGDERPRWNDDSYFGNLFGG